MKLPGVISFLNDFGFFLAGLPLIDAMAPEKIHGWNRLTDSSLFGSSVMEGRAVIRGRIVQG